MQPWESLLVTKQDSPYAGTAGCVVSRDDAKNSVTARMDKDGATVSFLLSEVQRLG